MKLFQVFVWFVALMISSLPAAERLHAGAAMVKITPPVGISMAGYYHKRGASAVHDDLYARAIVLSEGETKVALVSLDLISTRRSFVKKARALIQETLGIPAAHVMISATHAHTGPVLTEDRLFESQGASDPASVAFMKGLPEQISQSVVEANERLVPVETLAAQGEESSIAFNRRFHMRDGSVGWNPGKLNPNILKPAGPIDPEVPFVFFRELESRKPLALYVNYAVHLDNVGGDEVSADLPYMLTETLTKSVGPELVTVYTSGACGDINHIDVKWAANQKGHGNAARMGAILAAEVLRSWPELEPISGPLQARSRMVELDIPKVSGQAVNDAKLVVESADDRSRESFMRLVNAHKVLDVAEREGKAFEVEVQVITLGDSLAWVALPGEIFVELGLDLKAASPFQQTIVAELANGSIGYVPTSRAYRQGAYEVVSARCVKGSGDRLVECALKLLSACYKVGASE